MYSCVCWRHALRNLGLNQKPRGSKYLNNETILKLRVLIILVLGPFRDKAQVRIVCMEVNGSDAPTHAYASMCGQGPSVCPQSPIWFRIGYDHIPAKKELHSGLWVVCMDPTYMLWIFSGN